MRTGSRIWGVLFLLLGGVGAAQAQENAPFPVCPRDRTISVDDVRVARWDPSMGRARVPVPVDTIVLPTDSAFLYVTARVTVGVTQPGDSVYAIAALQLLLRSAPSPDNSKGAMVAFPSALTTGMLSPLLARTSLVLGPIPADSVIPWPERTVRATVNANPRAIRARVGVIQIRRASGGACVASLERSVGESKSVLLLYDP